MFFAWQRPGDAVGYSSSAVYFIFSQGKGIQQVEWTESILITDLLSLRLSQPLLTCCRMQYFTEIDLGFQQVWKYILSSTNFSYYISLYKGNQKRNHIGQPISSRGKDGSISQGKRTHCLPSMWMPHWSWSISQQNLLYLLLKISIKFCVSPLCSICHKMIQKNQKTPQYCFR